MHNGSSAAWMPAGTAGGASAPVSPGASGAPPGLLVCSRAGSPTRRDWSAATVSESSGACRPRWTAKRTGRSSAGTSSGRRRRAWPSRSRSRATPLLQDLVVDRYGRRRIFIIPGSAWSEPGPGVYQLVRLDDDAGPEEPPPNPSPPPAGSGSGPAATRVPGAAKSRPTGATARPAATGPAYLPASGCADSPVTSASASRSRAAGRSGSGMDRAAAPHRSRGRTRSR